MGYSIKWVKDKLGITLDMIRHYEKHGLLPANENRKYREYSDEDLDKIWGIKLLISIGFSVKEIYAIMNDPNFDFDAAIAEKVTELERKHVETGRYLEFAKSVKFIGRVPATSKIGSVRFDDFLAYALENWNFYTDPQAAPLIKSAEKLISKETQMSSSEVVASMREIFGGLDPEEWMNLYTLLGYYQVIADMREFGHDSEMVQRVVHLLYEYIVSHNTVPELDGKITQQSFAKYTAVPFLGGDIAKLNERIYGKDECLFIARALAYYGGYDIDDL